MNRVLFLDFDGVFITPRAAIAHGKCTPVVKRPDPVAVAALAAVGVAGVKIVVSSSWRKMEPDCRSILRNQGLEQFLHVDWRTRDDLYIVGGKLDRRGNQIASWLDDHPEVRSYRIVDDVDEMLPMQSPYLLLCHPYDGLGYHHIKKLLTWATSAEEEAA